MMEIDSQQPDAPPPQSTCLFWDLPQEILDMLFDCTYGAQAIRLTTKSSWEREETHQKKRKGQDYQMRPFPTPKVDEFMISKTYFLSAAKAWFAAQDWKFGPPSKSSFFKNRLFYEFGTHISLSYNCDSPTIFSCQRLKTVEMTVREDVFDSLCPKKLAWLEKFDQDDFEDLKITTSVKRSSGIRSLSIKAGPCWYAHTDSQRELWVENVAALEVYLRPLATGLRKPRRKLNEYSPLYSGSRVCCGTSELLPEDYYQSRPRKGGPFMITDKYRISSEMEKSVNPPQSAAELLDQMGMTLEEAWSFLQTNKP